jgi:predicted nucleic acid-binding protein
MIKRKMVDCLRIFLDTSILIDMFNTNSKDERVVFVKNLMDSLNENVTSSKKDRTFYISAITIGEMVKFSTKREDEVIHDIIVALDAKNIELVPYSVDIALTQNKLFKDYLAKRKLNKLLEELEAFPSNYLQGREHITRDFMIISSAFHINADVVLTCDKKTFLPIAELVNVFCITAYPNNFLLSGSGEKVYEFA